MGPVTMGGKKRMTFLAPTSLDDSRARTTYSSAGHHDAAAGRRAAFPRRSCRRTCPTSSLATASKPPRKAKEEPRKAGTFSLVQTWNSRVPRPAKQQGGLDGQGQAVALDQDGHQHRGAEHGEQVLQAQHQHLGQRPAPGRRRWRLVQGFSSCDSSSLSFALIYVMFIANRRGDNDQKK